MSDRYKHYVDLRKTGLSPSEISRQMGVSTGATGKWDKRFSSEYPDIYANVQSHHSKVMRRIGMERRKKNENAEIERLQSRVAYLEQQISLNEMIKACPIPDSVTTLGKGRIGELLVEYNLVRRGFEVCSASTVTGGTDLYVVLDNDRLLRLEIKSTYTPDLSVAAKRSHMRDNRWQRRGYEGCKVDFFIFVDLTHENIFVVPAKYAAGRTHSLSHQGPTWKYKDAYHLLK